MDHKRAILAIVLSAVVLVFWSWYFAPQNQPASQAPVAATTQQAQSGAAPGTMDSAAPEAAQAQPLEFAAAKGRDVTVSTPLYTAVFNTEGGVLKNFRLKKYKQSIEPGAPEVDLVGTKALAKGPLGLLWNGRATWRKGQWAADAKDVSIAGDAKASLVFTGSVDGLQIVRTLEFSADKYLITESVRLINPGDSLVSGRLGFTMATPILSAADDRYNMTRVSWLDGDGHDDESDTDDLAQGMLRDKQVMWGAIQSNYFILALAPEAAAPAMKAKYEDNIYRLAVEEPDVELAPKAETVRKSSYYMGPVLAEFLNSAPRQLSQAVTYGFFDSIAKLLLKAVNIFYQYTGNYGVAIIVLTVVIKIIFWPLSHKSYKSMNKMKKIQPLMAEVREKYKGDREKMNQEMIQLYKTYKVNPAGGCLPMLLQIPVFIGLYQALLGAIEMRHTPFITHLPFTDMIWLADLSAKDPFYITPLIMGASMFLQQKMTPAPGDPTQAKIMLFMPVIFTFVFLNFPSGLVVYWLVNNILSIAQQWWLLKKA